MSTPATKALATFALLAPATPLLAQNSPWNGFYAGINGGLVEARPDWSGTNIYQTVHIETGSSDTGDTFSFGAHTDTISESPSGSGFGGGARVGFNRQLGNFVIGAEADATLLSYTASAAASTPAASYQLRSHASNLETVRARAGIAFGRTLLFATGGLAFSNLTHNVTATDQSQVIVDGGEGSTGVAVVTNNLSATARSRSGWAVGGGGEVRLTDNLSAALTILHVDLGSADLADTEGPASIAVTARTRQLVGMFGINFHF